MDERRLSASLDHLKPGDRAILELSKGRGFPDERIAQLVGLTPPAVRRRRQLAVDRIAIEMGLLDEVRATVEGELDRLFGGDAATEEGVGARPIAGVASAPEHSGPAGRLSSPPPSDVVTPAGAGTAPPRVAVPPARRRRRGGAAGDLAVVVLVVLLGAGAIWLALRGAPGGLTSAEETVLPAPSPIAKERKQVESVLNGLNAALTRRDYAQACGYLAPEVQQDLAEDVRKGYGRIGSCEEALRMEDEEGDTLVDRYGEVFRKTKVTAVRVMRNRGEAMILCRTTFYGKTYRRTQSARKLGGVWKISETPLGNDRWRRIRG
jgi:hypothetical protein